MTTVFNLNRYDKIVANDLSLNGTISTALGGLSQWEDSGSDIYFSSGNVGIGTTSPTEKLHVNGNMISSDYNGNLYFGDSSWGVGGGNNNIRGASNSQYYTDIFGWWNSGDDRGFRLYNSSNNTVPFFVNSDGNVGVGTTSPNQKLHIKGDDDEYAVLEFEGRRSSGTRKDRRAFIGVGATGGNWGTDMYFRIRNGAEETVTWDTNSHNVLYMNGNTTHLYTGNTERMTINSSGYVGIGTTNPYAPLHVEGSHSTTIEGNKGAYFRWAENNNRLLTYNTSNTTMNVGIRSYQSIATNAYIISFSDKRLKKDIVELTDDSSLQKIRLLKPSSYKYKDPVIKNEFTIVDGFIAQEVKEIMPHATGITTDIIPNIMILGTSIIDGSNNYILTIPDFDTSTLEMDASNNLYPKLKIFLDKDEKRIVNIKEIVSATQLKVETDESLPEEIFIYGQEVDNVHTIIKDKIFTTGISALQEVDRQQQADKAKIASLETQVSTLETQLADVLQRLSNANI